MRIRFSIRVQLLVLSLFLFTIPYLGYQYVWELEQYLRTGQEQTMIGTARAVATALHERPALFESRSAYLKNVRPGTDLYAPAIPNPIRLDGELNDWRAVEHLATQYSDDEIVDIFIDTDKPVTSLSFTHMVGRYDQYLYAMFNVEDDHLVWRHPSSLSVDRSDHLLIALQEDTDTLKRYVIAPYESGWVNAYRLGEDQNAYRAVENALNIQGRWMETRKGYAIELRFPLDETSGSLAFALVDVDNEGTRQKQYAIGTASTSNIGELGTVVTPSPEIERILSGLKYADSRVWVVDKHKRVLARAGDILSSAGIRTATPEESSDSWLKWVEQNWLIPLYYNILTRPPADFVDELENAYALVGKDIATALSGEPDSLWRLTPDNKAVVLSAAHPIFIGDTVMGAVIVEQTTHGIRTLRNQALERLFHVILAVMLLGTSGLLLFAHRISSRIRSLRDNTEAVIDDNGKIIGSLPQSKQRDEIGDLNRSFSDVLSRLQQYNTYLENMASRLSHELRTPIAVVKSSLDTLSQVSTNEENNVFVERAQSGITRLSKILNSMSEATRLEQAIATEESIPFELNKVVSGCVLAYQQTYSNRTFNYINNGEGTEVIGSPDLIAQLLDKVIANAAEFSNDEDTITVHLWRQDKSVYLTVSNPGPVIPAGMENQLIQSMVSIRPEAKAHLTTPEPHLGLGLFIANMVANYHKGNLSITNLEDNTGVCVKLSLPLIPT
ncbi:proteobacterial dedicated sortase system histidine kinase [Alteromonas sp. KUL49]|uniref:proteobacterial dedicated sortase system histidine kinase n=1 Tax=Alteromonas sp. KUL49 TaxID=2480798 RepID=UPI00102F1888|nr:proteobacterial dedicated sortase system histidine kinase [Alteromonas sp. KUL49]TAP37992.1 proteobacterial dedicated sortase system histidine kinase [Alteromonas sp. KUL49]GEA12865.1 proteobacterial dedicated sortase system histidine kinase [Alteromonas sp. KUL49]